MLGETEDLEEAKVWADEALGIRNSAKYYMAKENFVAAYRSGDSFSFLTNGDYFYSQMYGHDAHFDDRSKYLSVTGGDRDLKGMIYGGRGFQFWEALTTPRNSAVEILNNVEEINSIITDHAPDSSVRPGDDEEVFWGGVRSESGELVACAVVVRWQSGFHILASVVTRESDRGRGYATALSAGIISHAHSLGIKEIGLGVRTSNIAAQRAYEKAGFTRLAEFKNYARE